MRGNIDTKVVEAFGAEWSRFSNEELSAAELAQMFEQYVSIFPWDDLPPDAVGFDAGCGSGRWAKFFAERVGQLHCIDASGRAIEVARRTLAGRPNVRFYHEDLESISLADESCDFGYALGVLHHIPDPLSAAQTCVNKLKPGAPFLVYIYYSLESAGVLQRALLQAVTITRCVVSRLPTRVRHVVADVVAAVVYAPLAWLARVVERLGRDPARVPLFQYRHRSFYVMRNDALDRFGTRLEQRFTRRQVVDLLEAAGLERIVISESPPWWVAVGRKARPAPPNDG